MCCRLLSDWCCDPINFTFFFSFSVRISSFMHQSLNSLYVMSWLLTEWILEYKQKRPGLKALQERIDEFIVAHEEQQEKVSVSSMTYISSEEAKQGKLFVPNTYLIISGEERKRGPCSRRWMDGCGASQGEEKDHWCWNWNSCWLCISYCNARENG